MSRFPLIAAALVALGLTAAPAGAQTLLNVSYDPTRELYQALNKLFIADQAKAGKKITINQSHGGSGGQARAVIDGLDADVVTLAIASDISAIADRGLIDKNWQSRLPDNSTPYTSTIVFLVRKGNPKGLKDWDDLVKPGVQIITPNPKTSGGARWNYLAAWGYALKTNGGDQEKAKAFVSQILKQVPVLDTGARGSTVTFAERGLGDVLLSWENEAYLAFKEFGADKFDIVYPSISIFAEPPVTVVDKNVDKKKTREIAEAYLKFLYTPEAQDIIAQNYYRPRSAEAAAKYAKNFPKIELFTVDELFGSLDNAQKTHFAENGVFDQIYAKK